MSISLLPQSTVQVLISSQAITNSTSLIKELVENSLDANASSVAVEISANALDIVQVKDNGYGIAPEGRDQLARRNCTSKIRSLEDLANIGGRFLGFRGVALASAAEMSGGLFISTQIDCEPVGEVLSFDRRGNIQSRQLKPLPRGTTVRAEDFLKYIPVRKQACLKIVARIRRQIKSLLESYALTRPNVRFSFKVFQDDKSQWVYAAPKGATMVDPAIKIFGVSAVTNCSLQLWNQSEGLTKNWMQPHKEDEYSITALLPKYNCDSVVTEGLGQHLSVDFRPVSCKRGTLKKIVDIFKKYLQQALGKVVSSPVLCLNLNCPTGTYDVNIEPAKDDVLFVNEDAVINVFDAFFKAVYERGHEILEPVPTSTRETIPSFKDRGVKDSNPLEMKGTANWVLNNQALVGEETPELLNSKPVPSEDHTVLRELVGETRNKLDIHIEKGNSSCKQNGDRTSTTVAKASMLDDLDDLENQNFDLSSDDEDFPEDEESLDDVRVSNPWTIAKMNAPVRKRISEDTAPDSIDFNDQLFTPPRFNSTFSPVKPVHRPTFPAQLRTPVASPTRNSFPTSLEKPIGSSLNPPRRPLAVSPEPGAQLNHQAQLMPRGQVDAPRPQNVPQTQKSGPMQGQLDSWMRRQLPAPSLTSTPSIKSSQSVGIALADIPEASSRSQPRSKAFQRSAGINKPFMPPMARGSVQPKQQKPKPCLARQGLPAQWSQSVGDLGATPRQSRLSHPGDGFLPQKPPASSPMPPGREPQKKTPHLPPPQRPQRPPGNIWLRQASTSSQGPDLSAKTLNKPHPPPAITRPQPRSPRLCAAEAHPNTAALPTLKITTSETAIATSFASLALHDAYLLSGSNAQGFVFENLKSSSVKANVLVAWERRLRRLLAGLERSFMVEGELNVGRALALAGFGT